MASAPDSHAKEWQWRLALGLSAAAVVLAIALAVLNGSYWMLPLGLVSGVITGAMQHKFGPD